MTKQDRRDMFIAAALTGLSTKQDYFSRSRIEDSVSTAILLAEEVLKQTEYVYEKSELDEID